MGKRGGRDSQADSRHVMSIKDAGYGQEEATVYLPTRISRSVTRGARGGRGQSLVEFALILPVLVILILGIVDFGMGLRSYISLTNATREGARFAAIGSTAGAYPTDCDGTINTSVIGRVCVALEGLQLSNVQNVTVAYPNGQMPGESVVVSTHYHYQYITPLPDFVDFFSAGSLPEYINMDASTDMRLD